MNNVYTEPLDLSMVSTCLFSGKNRSVWMKKAQQAVFKHILSLERFNDHNAAYLNRKI